MGVCETTGIAAEVRDILVFHLGVEEALIKGDVRLVDLGADSLDVIEIAMSCEETFRHRHFCQSRCEVCDV